MKQKIYLAGGMRSNWQQKVIDQVNAEYYNPRTKEVDNVLTLDEYGTWDLHHIKKCEIVFAYMERINPSGIGMSVELGFAKALGKTVILCLEDDNEYNKDRSLQFTKKVADVVFTEIDEAIEYLQTYTV